MKAGRWPARRVAVTTTALGWPGSLRRRRLRPALRLVRRTLREAGLSRPPVPDHDDGEGTSLSTREKAVVVLAGEGCTSAEIAERLGLQTRTVDTLIGSAMVKLGARTRIEAVVRHRRGVA